MSCSKKPEPLHSLVNLPEGITLPPITSTALSIPEEIKVTEKEIKLTLEVIEDRRRLHQARLAHRLKSGTARRLLGQSNTADASSPVTADVSPVHPFMFGGDNLTYDFFRELKSKYPKPENNWVFEISDARFVISNMRPILGNLEARPSGFTFYPKPDENCHMLHFKDTSVKLSFFVRDDQGAYVLHFRLYQAMEYMLGFPPTVDLVFVARAGESDAKNFCASVPLQQWDSQSGLYTLEDLEDEDSCQFNGVSLDKRIFVVALSSTALVVMEDCPPYDVFLLSDIEIVNLAHAASGEILMTVVFKDFSLPVLQIYCKIDLSMLSKIKEILDFWDVKYYCNNKCSLDWNSLLRGILERPKEFVESGGWESLDLEDEHTLSYYKAGAPKNLLKGLPIFKDGYHPK